MNFLLFAFFLMAGVKFGFGNAIMGGILLVAFAWSGNKHNEEMRQLKKNGGKYPYGTYWPNWYD
jgi:hypothetical protein